MNKLNEIEVSADLLKLKKLSRELQQISYSFKKTEERFSDISFAPIEEMVRYMRTLLAYKNDIDVLVEEWSRLYEKYRSIE